MAKKFFYVCAGLFLLVLGFSLGARSVTAQGGTQLDTGGLLFHRGNGAIAAGVANRIVFYTTTFPITEVKQIPVPLPGTSPAVAIEAWDIPDQYLVLLANGDLYAWEGQWFLAGNLMNGATSVRSSSWGQVKDRYRK